VIFVSVGSSTIPFERLLRAVDNLAADEQLIVQYGASGFRPRRAECVDFLSNDEFRAHVQRARVTVIHAGAGSIITTLALGKHPIVVPRRAAHREAVDDHQLPFARRAGELGIVTVVEDLERDLSMFIEEAVGKPATAPGRGGPRTAWQ